MRKKLAIATITMLLGISAVACGNDSKDPAATKAPATSGSPSGSGSSTTANPNATTNPDSPYTQEQEIELQSRDISGYITVGEYKGVKIDDFSITVNDQTISDYIDSVRKNNATYTDTAADYVVADGDQVVIDYVGKVDGVAFDKGSANDQTLIIGSKTYIDGFESGIIGHKAGETFDINVTFPENYGSSELAGKAAVFTITLDSIKNTVLPELNDEFVQKVSTTSKTVDEYKAEVKAQLESNAKQSEETQKEDAVWDAVLANCTVAEYPKELVEYYTYNSRLQITTQIASSYNMTLAQYLEAVGQTEEEFTKEREEDAKAYLEKLMLLQYLSKKEGLQVTDEQYQEQLKLVLDSNNYKTEDELKENVGNLAPITLKRSILYDNVTKFLIENCKVEAK